LVRSKKKESVQRRTEQRRWSIEARRQDAGGAVESIEVVQCGPEAGCRRSREKQSIPIYIVMKQQREGRRD
jgi:hypothetical protein